jgi:threonine dehydratase
MEELREHPISISETMRSLSMVRRYVKPTPLPYYEGLSKINGTHVYIKQEHHNPHR